MPRSPCGVMFPGMPYRESSPGYCVLCAAPTELQCRHCHRAVCVAHAAAYAFFTPVIECSGTLAGSCERVDRHGAENRRHDRHDRVRRAEGSGERARMSTH